MRILGSLIGESKSGFWIVRGEFAPSEGTTAVNEELVPVGRIKDIFGPIEKPFVSVAKDGEARPSPGDRIYVLTRNDRRMKRWRSSKT
jgi:RNA-binding protein